ncbi:MULTISPECIES: GNAT family N-acetyltransferase [Nocardiopsidaceae]|uniref:GNAT family N-acetyltransferase n=1 Tax=Streptomonospora nanhaiensis TaxID=1323731 RepID=A0ABY6YS60_9ACTN|nr:GNAT family N-acetyltransferase [Streptomonospora nanhaiensis]WAE75192.1 GNAT family N-acetyltransferase [Streptomonospora nanhaiensis]
MTVEIRQARRADTPGLFSLLHRTNPCRVLTEEVVLWRLDHPSAEFEETVLIAVEEDGSVVGHIRAVLRRGGEATPRTGVSVLASVAATHLGTGLDSRLLDASEAVLVARGAGSLRAEAAGEGVQVGGEDFAALLAERGYSPVESHHVLGLDLEDLPEVPPAPEGVELRPFERFADDPRPVYDIDRLTTADEPGADNDGRFMSYDEWRSTVWPRPDNDHAVSQVILVDGAPVGMTCYTSDGGSRVESAMTGVLREYRGRGLAGYAKTAALHLARDRGAERAYTGNHEDNAPMLAVNRRLGYEPVAAATVYSRAVGG